MMPLSCESRRAETVHTIDLRREAIDKHIRYGRHLQAQMIASLFGHGFRALKRGALHLVSTVAGHSAHAEDNLAHPRSNRG